MNKHKRHLCSKLILAVVIVQGTGNLASGRMAFDLIIKHGQIVDGTGQQAFEGDIAI